MANLHTTRRGYLALCADNSVQTNMLVDLLTETFGPWRLLCSSLAAIDLRQCRLLLIDANSLDLASCCRWLDQIYKHTGHKPSVGLINLPAGDQREQLAHWPQVNGIFRSTLDQQQLLDGVETLLRGCASLPESVLANVLHVNRKRPNLLVPLPVQVTPRELQILRFMMAGYRNQDIAEELEVSKHTVKSHVYNLFRKISVKNRVQAVTWAERYLGDLGEDKPLPS
ncbi:LuxR C-terminal-related transcriptional regulator [Oceanobacter mangrovi]|uniref:LuxR C-terminal-related transcriptional regulator n=1 Tax=Oceanobacter mangrovi TaxID=2862510 RepID=UPI001C8DC165|nr:LuxR C-terminal-related transcriptional regulator [Oceanobacter mangrovi]